MGRTHTFDLGDRLRAARERAGYKSRERFADELGIARNSVGNYERGDTTPNRLTIKGWADLTGFDFDWLLTGEKSVDLDAVYERNRRRRTLEGPDSTDPEVIAIPDEETR